MLILLMSLIMAICFVGIGFGFTRQKKFILILSNMVLIGTVVYTFFFMPITKQEQELGLYGLAIVFIGCLVAIYDFNKRSESDE